MLMGSHDWEALEQVREFALSWSAARSVAAAPVKAAVTLASGAISTCTSRLQSFFLYWVGQEE